MAHHVRIRKDPGWALGSLWTAAEQSALDSALVGSVNGDGGGLWSPTSNLVIQGAGLRLIAATSQIAGTPSSVTTDGVSKIITHGDSDYCVLGAGHTGAAVSIRSPVADARSSMGWSTPGATSPFSIFATALDTIARVPLRVHNGATFAGMTISFAVNTNAVAIPKQTPRFGVFARDAYGNKTTLFPYYQISPLNLAGWVSSGQPQIYPIMLSSPSVVIDTSRYSYFAEIVEASGTGAIVGGVTYFDPIAHFINVLDIRPR